MATATMIVKHRVANFETWKVVFDEMEATRRKHGWLGHELLRDASDPNVVTIVNHIQSLDGAKAYGQSPELKSAMARGGIQGAPEVLLLTDVEARRY